VKKAQTDLNRARDLRAANAVPEERLDDAQSSFDSAQATLTQIRAQVVAAQESKRAAVARVSERRARHPKRPVDAQVAAARANAELAHAHVTSAEAALLLQEISSLHEHQGARDGRRVEALRSSGQLVGVGQSVVEIVPTTTYVIANFKETQVGRMRPGERATIEIDAYPRRKFEGKVESISGGTGASFSLLPADNASGNFVKVVQRVPVRIAWVNLPSDVSLRAGPLGERRSRGGAMKTLGRVLGASALLPRRVSIASRASDDRRSGAPDARLEPRALGRALARRGDRLPRLRRLRTHASEPARERAVPALGQPLRDRATAAPGAPPGTAVRVRDQDTNTLTLSATHPCSACSGATRSTRRPPSAPKPRRSACA
jgi:hypothetical protein